LGCAVIRIRYRSANELSPGLHAAAERRGRNTTVYLLAGLRPAERRAALRRLRISARMGHSPRLPAAQLALALLADRFRTALGQAGAIFRSHPAGSTVPVMVISAGAIAFLALSAVSIRVIHAPRAPGVPLAAGASAASAGAEVPIPGSSDDPSGGGVLPGGAGAASELLTPGRTASGAAGAAGNLPGQPGASGAAGTGGGGNTGGSTGSGVGTTLAGNADQTPSPEAGGSGTAPAAATSSAAPATSAPAAQPSPSKSASSGACLHLGPLGVCL
jgi:hypothetical protein